MTVFIFGEAMLECHSRGGGSGLRYGGDTLNTAIHMARLGQDVAYVTALGTDPVSDALVAAWADEGVDTRYILRHPSRGPGIYAIHVDDTGERSFLYWRDRSAARDLFTLPEIADVLAAAREASLLYFSLISLAILPPKAREQLIGLAGDVRNAGRMVAYDSNFRANLWDDVESARTTSAMAIATATIGLPTNVDEQQISGRPITDAKIAQLWLTGGCTEVVVKGGEAGCLFGSCVTPDVRYPADRIQPIDSSGAGDAFNAGYLSARLNDLEPLASIEAGQSLAKWVISRSGAIPPVDQAAPYRR